MNLGFILMAGGLAALFAQNAAAEPSRERFSIVANQEVVGYLEARTEGDRTSVAYHVDNNGRGPKHVEEIVLGEGRLPVSWSVNGASLMGGPVAETYQWADGRGVWRSQADAGEASAARPGLYLVNDASPWALGVYARAALASPDQAVAALPGGRVSVETVRSLSVGQGAAAVPVTVYRLIGLNLAPSYLMLDADQRLFAVFNASSLGDTAIREGHEDLAAFLQGLASDLEVERVEALQARLAHVFDAPVRVRNVRIFDPRSGALSPLSTVVVMHDVITQILRGDGGEPPADETVVEGEGGTIYPGLFDMHAHATLDSGLLYLAAGVTSVRDMGNDNVFLLDLMRKSQAGAIAWPRITPNGFIEGRSPYSARLGRLPETLEEAKEDIRWYADRGYYEIKLYNSINPDWVRPLADEAHRLGLRIGGHVPAFSTPDRVIEDGYDMIAHLNQLMLGWILEPGEDTRTPLRLTAMARGGDLDLQSPRVRRTVDLMVENEVALDTTASILEQLMLSRAGEVQAGQADFLDHMPVGFQRYRKRSYVTLESAADDQAYQEGFAKVLETIGMLHDRGVVLLPGTDDATGFSVLRELELYVAGGLTPVEALRAGGYGMADYLGQTNRLGLIERGKLADFVLVQGDPTRSISAIRRPRMVVKGGTFYFPSEIYEALGIRPFVDPPVLRPATETAAPSTGGPVSGFSHEGEGHVH
ncbi:amidohydrolase family protein [Brevundimonas diminuta]|uniref:amidohydrolase family protein n=1 Tax=Brevundimonas diminuta TaxID=293 RepID=UPI0037C6B07C